VRSSNTLYEPALKSSSASASQNPQAIVMILQERLRALQDKSSRQEAQLELLESALKEQLQYSALLQNQITMFSSAMQTFQKDSALESKARETELVNQVAKLREELDKVVKQASQIN